MFKKPIQYFKTLSPRFAHWRKIERLRQQHCKITKSPKTYWRAIWVLLAATCTFGLMNLFELIYWDGWTPHWISQPTKGTSFIKLSHLIITAPIFFAIWAFRDASRLHEIANKRKDTNLKEFQQLQEWATDNTDDNIALKISALHSLRGYLKGEYGQSFRRGAFEIFASELSTQHKKILQQVADNDNLTIKKAIDNNPLCKQLNRIVEEDWFNLLISHNFPTATISLVGVNLSGKYLRHKDFGKSLNLSNANLQGANLREAKLQRANLRWAELQGANLRWTKLQGASLFKAQLQEASLFKAQLQGVSLRWTQLQGVSLSWAELQGADLRWAELQGANLREAQLQGVSLSWAELQGTDLRGARLQGADLSEARLQGANLRGARLQGADLSEARLQGADLSEARLQGAYAGKKHDSLNFVKRINQQTDKATDIQALKGEPLKAEQKEKIIAGLSKINKYWIKDAIKRIENAGDTLDLSTAETGSYNKQQAQQWIKQYEKYTSNAKKWT